MKNDMCFELFYLPHIVLCMKQERQYCINVIPHIDHSFVAPKISCFRLVRVIPNKLSEIRHGNLKRNIISVQLLVLI